MCDKEQKGDACYESGRRIVWFGGTFDPVHNGHLEIARFVADQLPADLVVMAPAACNPLKAAPMADQDNRLAMLKMAVGDDPLFEVDPVELKRPQPSYTIDTMELVISEREDDEIFFLTGADSLEDFASWHRVGELMKMVSILVACRPPTGPAHVQSIVESIEDSLGIGRGNSNISILSSPLIDISSTDIRNRISNGVSVDGMLPALVEQYIRQKGLYNGISC